MASAEYLQRGEALNYTNTGSSTIDAGTVIELTGRIAVTGCDIEPSQVGSIHMVGVFEIPKTGTSAIDQGQTVYFDGTGITDAADDGNSPAQSYTKAGYAAAAAGASATSILVQIGG